MIKVHVREWYLYKVDCLREIYRCVSIWKNLYYIHSELNINLIVTDADMDKAIINEQVLLISIFTERY